MMTCHSLRNVIIDMLLRDYLKVDGVGDPKVGMPMKWIIKYFSIFVPNFAKINSQVVKIHHLNTFQK